MGLSKSQEVQTRMTRTTFVNGSLAELHINKVDERALSGDNRVRRSRWNRGRG